MFTFVLQFLIPSLVSGEIAIMCSLEFLNMDINTFGMSLQQLCPLMNKSATMTMHGFHSSKERHDSCSYLLEEVAFPEYFTCTRKESHSSIFPKDTMSKRRNSNGAGCCGCLELADKLNSELRSELLSAGKITKKINKIWDLSEDRIQNRLCHLRFRLHQDPAHPAPPHQLPLRQGEVA